MFVFLCAVYAASCILNNNYYYCDYQVNGDDLRQATHEKAVLSLMKPSSEIQLVVRHDPQPDGFQVSN